MTVNIRENQGASGDVYMFDPASITIKKGDTITVQNRSDEMQDIDQGDAQKAGVDVAIPVNQSAMMTFNVAGSFTIRSEKGATITITVQG
jgi:plastocyanin